MLAFALFSCKGETFLSRKYTKGYYFSFRERPRPTQDKTPLKTITKIVQAGKSEPAKLKKETEAFVAKKDFLDTVKNYSSLNLHSNSTTQTEDREHTIQKNLPSVPDASLLKNKYRHDTVHLRSAQQISLIGYYYALCALIALSFFLFMLAFYIYTGAAAWYFLLVVAAGIIFIAWCSNLLGRPHHL